MIFRHPVNAGNHVGIAARARAIQHPYCSHRRLLGDTIGAANSRAGDMGTMAVTVGGIRRVSLPTEVEQRANQRQRTEAQETCVVHCEVTPLNDPAHEFLVGGPEPGIDDIHIDTAAGLIRILVGFIQREVRLIHAVQAPGGIRLGSIGHDNRIRLHCQHTRHGLEHGRLCFAQLNRRTG
ncbi:MAG: hypothetical protein R6W86_04280 [Marinobacter sp.]